MAKKFYFFLSFVLINSILATAVFANELLFTKAFPKLRFNKPIFFSHAGDSSGRVYLAEQTGRIFSFANNKETKKADLFLDISDRITSGGELGLLGLAFHPDFRNNGFFYLNSTRENPLRTVISRFKVVNGIADRNSEEIILEFNQPYDNHNGGMIQFGNDGFLYIGTGDGGAGGDPDGHGQNTNSMLGKLLRIDVNKKDKGKNYRIPSDNPFSGNIKGKKAEIWAYGFRNPWRFDIDRVTGKIWLADVGQGNYEEIDLVEKGKNYGWNTMEGFHCFEREICRQKGLSLPVVEYNHEQGQSVTGGIVYRGREFPEMNGVYFYGDFVSGKIWTIHQEKNAYVSKPFLNTNFSISSFGTDQENNLYLLDYRRGEIYKLVRKK